MTFSDVVFLGILKVNDNFVHREPVVQSRMSQDRDESEDEYEQMEEARLRDLEERDAFADRLKGKDKEKTRQVMSKTEKKVRKF